MLALRRPPLRVWIWTAATVMLAVLATLLWRGSDAAATEHSTAAASPAPSGTPAGRLTSSWSAGATVLPRPVVESGRVILGSTHGIRALDPTTGREVWHYTRGNAALCGLTAVDDRVVAVYRTAGRCDEAVALVAATGVYAWTRSVDLRPDATLSSTAGIVLAASPTGLVTIDPTGDNLRWHYAAPDGCRLAGAVAGSAGVAVLTDCAGSATPQLRLLDGYTGQPHWSQDVPGGEVALAGADSVVSLVVGDSLQARARTDGSVVTTAVLGDAVVDGAPLETAVANEVLVWSRGTLVALSPSAGRVLWQQPALGLPVTRIDLKNPASSSALLVPEDGAFVHRDLLTGVDGGRSTVDGQLPSGGLSEQVGASVVYALADRVISYR